MRENDRQRPLPQAEADGIIEGRNAVIEALRSGREHRQNLPGQGRDRSRPWAIIASRARERPASWWWSADRRKLDGMSQYPQPTRGSSPWRLCGNM